MKDTPPSLSLIDRSKGATRFSLPFPLRSHKTRRGMKTSTSNPPTAPPTIAPTGMFEPADLWTEDSDEVDAGAVKTRLGIEARLGNEGVYMM